MNCLPVNLYPLPGVQHHNVMVKVISMDDSLHIAGTNVEGSLRGSDSVRVGRLGRILLVS